MYKFVSRNKKIVYLPYMIVNLFLVLIFLLTLNSATISR